MWFLGTKKMDQSEWDRRHAEVVASTREGRLDEALPLAQSLAEASGRSFGKHHANTMTTRNNLGLIHILRNEFDRAEAQLLAALGTCEKLHGKSSKESAVINANLAKLFERRARRIRELDGAFQAT